MARNKLVFVKMRDGHRGVVLFATGIGKAEVHEFDFVFLHQFHHVCNGLGHQVLLGKALVKKSSKRKAVCVPGQCFHAQGRSTQGDTRVLRHPASPKQCTQACKDDYRSFRTNSGPQFAPTSCNPASKSVQAAGTSAAGPFTPNSMWRPYCG